MEKPMVLIFTRNITALNKKKTQSIVLENYNGHGNFTINAGFAKVGDTLLFLTNNLQQIDNSLITSISNITGTTMEIFLSSMPSAIAVNNYVENWTARAKANIINSRFSSNRARGILIQTGDVLIDSCQFNGMSGSAIQLTTDVYYFFEAGAARNITIKNSTFDNCNSGTTKMLGDIAIFAELANQVIAPAGVHHNILIENNTFTNSARSPIWVASARQVTIKDNNMSRYNIAPNGETHGVNAIYIEKSDSIFICNNTVDGTLYGQTNSTNIS